MTYTLKAPDKMLLIINKIGYIHKCVCMHIVLCLCGGVCAGNFSHIVHDSVQEHYFQKVESFLM